MESGQTHKSNKWLKKLFGLFLIICTIWGIYLLSSLFFISFFRISGHSMEPTLYTGDYVLIDHPILGTRIKNPIAALRGEEVETQNRLNPPVIRRNEVVVFNFPYPHSWQQLQMSLNTYYIKRCIAIPGDTLEIRNGFYILNHEIGIAGHQENQHRLSERPPESFTYEEFNAYPHHPYLNWSIKEFGPLYIPGCHSHIRLTPLTLLLYKNLIEWEQKLPLRFINNQYFLGDQAITEYNFRKNYYFMAGDHVETSEDSRYWGLVPEDFIVGKALFILKSKDESNNYRWQRFLKRIQ